MFGKHSQLLLCPLPVNELVGRCDNACKANGATLPGCAVQECRYSCAKSLTVDLAMGNELGPSNGVAYMQVDGTAVMQPRSHAKGKS